MQAGDLEFFRHRVQERGYDQEFAQQFEGIGRYLISGKPYVFYLFSKDEFRLFGETFPDVDSLNGEQVLNYAFQGRMMNDQEVRHISFAPGLSGQWDLQELLDTIAIEYSASLEYSSDFHLDVTLQLDEVSALIVRYTSEEYFIPDLTLREERLLERLYQATPLTHPPSPLQVSTKYRLSMFDLADIDRFDDETGLPTSH